MADTSAKNADRTNWKLIVEIKDAIVQHWSKMQASFNYTVVLNIALLCVTSAIFLYHSSLIVLRYQMHEVETTQITLSNLSLMAPVVRIDHDWSGSPLLANLTYKNGQNSNGKYLILLFPTGRSSNAVSLVYSKVFVSNTHPL